MNLDSLQYKAEHKRNHSLTNHYIPIKLNGIYLKERISYANDADKPFRRIQLYVAHHMIRRNS